MKRDDFVRIVVGPHAGMTGRVVNVTATTVSVRVTSWAVVLVLPRHAVRLETFGGVEAR